MLAGSSARLHDERASLRSLPVVLGIASQSFPRLEAPARGSTTARAGRDRSQRRERVFALQIGCSLTNSHLVGLFARPTAAAHESRRDDGDNDCDGGGSRTLLIAPRPLTSIRWSLSVVRRKRPERTRSLQTPHPPTQRFLPCTRNGNGEWLASAFREPRGPSIQVLALIARPSMHLRR
jgi:hypothetical protein